MTQWHRKIGRQITNTLPAWVTSIMAANGGTFPTNKLFEVGPSPGYTTTNWLADKINFPEVDKGGMLYAGTDGTYSTIHAGYGSSVYVPELGAHGTMVFGCTGENVIVEQLSYWPISDDSPVWGVFQQPKYYLNAQDASTHGASWYYDPAMVSTIQSQHPGRVIPMAMAGTGVYEGTWGQTWDRGFPVGHQRGWVIPDLSGDSILGDNRPIAFRYNMPVYIPPSMTGNGAGAIVVNERSWHGPFDGYSGPPNGSYSCNNDDNPIPNYVDPSEWYTAANVWASGRKKCKLYALNVQTKQWSVIATLPDFLFSYAGNIAQPFAFVDRAAKRIYYTCDSGGVQKLYYADFSSGIGAVSVGGPTAMTEYDSEHSFSQSHSNADLYTGGGKKLYYYKNGTNKLGMIDLAGNAIYELNVSNGPPATGAFWYFSVDQANGRVFIVIKDTDANTVTLWKFNVPSDPTNASNYTVTGPTSINMNGITMEALSGGSVDAYGGRHSLLTTLGGLMLMNQRTGKMLVIKPN